MNILSNNSPVTTALGAPIQTGTAARIYIGQMPQGVKLAAINVLRDSTAPSDTKDGVSRVDVEEIIVQICAINYVNLYDIAKKVRTALDNTSYNQTVNVVGTQYTETINIEHLWFAGETYSFDTNEDKIIDIFEQRYMARIKR